MSQMKRKERINFKNKIKSLLNKNNLGEAEELLDGYLKENPEDITFLRFQGRVFYGKTIKFRDPEIKMEYTDKLIGINENILNAALERRKFTESIENFGDKKTENKILDELKDAIKPALIYNYREREDNRDYWAAAAIAYKYQEIFKDDIFGYKLESKALKNLAEQTKDSKLFDKAFLVAKDAMRNVPNDVWGYNHARHFLQHRRRYVESAEIAAFQAEVFPNIEDFSVTAKNAKTRARKAINRSEANPNLESLEETKQILSTNRDILKDDGGDRGMRL